MTPADAAKLLELPDNASPEQIEARFLELRRKLEDKIAKAPTPGLQAKYRESLTEVTTAFETLALAADSSSLPVLKKEAGEGRPEAGGPAPGGHSLGDGRSRRAAGDGGAATPPRGPDSGFRSQVSGLPPPKKTKSGREFLLVAIIAVVVLAAGGWFVMKTRTENAEQARIAAVAKAAEEAKAAEVKRLAEAAHLAAQTEQERREKVLVQARARLAEIRATWEVFNRAERDAERALTDARGDLRSLRDAPPGRMAEMTATARARERYHQWIADFLLRHPARTQRAQAEEMVSAGAADEAAQLIASLASALPEMEAEIRREQQARLAITGTLNLTSEPAGLGWTIEDAFGRKFSGRTPSEIPEVAAAAAKLTLQRAGWLPRVREVRVEAGRSTDLTERYADQGHGPEWLFQASATELEAAAREGWAEAALELGDRYLMGLSGTMDYEQARRWYESARTAGHPGFGARIYLLQSRTNVAPFTRTQIRELMGEGVKAGDPLSVLCWLESRRQDPEQEPIASPRVAAAVERGTRRAEQGDRLIQLMLASYFLTDAEPPDEAKAFALAKAASAAGNKRALRFLSYRGLRDEKDTAGVSAALELIRQAIKANDTAAMVELGSFYSSGQLVAKDEQEALRLWRLAAAQGNTTAQLSLGYAYFLGQGVPADESAGVAWWRKAAAAGNAAAMNELGFAMQRGRGIAQNYNEAVNWFRRAAELNHPKGFLNLGYAASNGWGVPQSDTEALAWWRKAAAADDPYALANLAWATLYGRGVPQSEPEAVKYWQQAARLGHEPAQALLRERKLTW